MAKKTPTPQHPSESDRKNRESLGLERLIFFSDAVIAIAITLLALEIRLPPHEEEQTNAQLLQSLLSIWPSYLSYLVSFLVIGVFWISHHRKFRYIVRYDAHLLQLNLLLLLVVAFIPFPTAILGEYGNRTATIFYALIITVLGLLNAAVWLYASYRHRLINPVTSPQQIRHETLRTLVVPGVFLLSIALAFLDPDANLAKYSWLLVAVVLKQT